MVFLVYGVLGLVYVVLGVLSIWCSWLSIYVVLGVVSIWCSGSTSLYRLTIIFFIVTHF